MKYLVKNPLLTISFLVGIIYSAFLTGLPTVNADAQIILSSLENVNSVVDYLCALFSFKTIDFQPLRDLTFFIDIFLFNKFRINTFVIQNLFWWIGCCFMMFKLAKNIYPSKDDSTILAFILLFSVYPLFTHVVSWGVARKHLMAFFFIICATNELLKGKEFTKKTCIKISFLFLLSVLSQPIGILWPVGVYLYFFLNKNSRLNIHKFLLVPLLIIQIYFLVLNYLYYAHSKTFLFHYAPKSSSTIEIGDKILALGHYHFQLLFPYLLSFTYELGHYSVFIGLIFFTFLGLLIYKDNRILIVKILYLIFGWSPIFLVLVTPHQLYDTYLLIPCCSLFLFFLYYIPVKPSRLVNLILIFFLFIQSTITFFESKRWLSNVDLTESSFNHRPSCKNAINYARLSYEANKVPSNYVKKFLKENHCLKNVVVTDYGLNGHINFLSYILFHEEFFDIEERIARLDEFAKDNLIPAFIKTALLLKLGRVVEADETIKGFIEKMKSDKKKKNQYNYIAALYVHPYCQKKKWKECTDITSKYSQYIPQPYL